MSTNEELAIDVAGVHPTCTTYLGKEVKFIQERKDSAEKSRSQHSLDPMARAPGPSLKRIADKKRTKYQMLISIARKQALAGRRETAPKFFAPVFSHLGELSPDVFAIEDWLCAKLKSKTKAEGPRGDGYTPAQIVSRARQKFRDQCQIAIAKRISKIMLTAGLPFKRNN